MDRFENSPAWRRAAYAAIGIALAAAMFWIVERLLLLGVVRHLVALAVAAPFGMLLYGALEDVVEDALDGRRERRKASIEDAEVVTQDEIRRTKTLEDRVNGIKTSTENPTVQHPQGCGSDCANGNKKRGE